MRRRRAGRRGWRRACVSAAIDWPRSEPDTYMRSTRFRLPSASMWTRYLTPLAAAAAMLAVAAAADAQTTPKRPLPSAIEAPPAPDLIRLSATVERLVARVRPAVVQVLTTAYMPGEAAAR